MKFRLYRKEVVIKSPLKVEDVKKLIQREIGKDLHYSLLWPNRTYKFEGEIEGQSFRIYQLFDYGNRNYVRPEINGTIAEKGSGSELVLKFGLSTPFLLLFYLLPFAGIVYFCLSLYTGDFIWLVAVICIPFMLLIISAQFHSKAKDCSNCLSLLVKGHEVEHKVQ